MNGSITLQSKLAGASALVGRLRGSVSMANTIINGGASPYPKHVGPAAICSFSDGAQDAPLKSLVFSIEPKQSGSGDPSPTNIRPISGWTQVDGVAAGKNLCPKLVPGTSHGMTLTVDEDGVATLTGQSDSTGQTVGRVEFDLPAGTYLATGGNANYTLRIYSVTDSTTLAVVDSPTASKQITLATSKRIAAFVRADSAVAISTPLKFYPMLRFASETDANFAPYKGTPITIQLGQTVYGGTVDAISGKLVVDRAMVTFDGSESGWSKSGSALNGYYKGMTGSPYYAKASTALISDKFSYTANRNTYFNTYGKCYCDTAFNFNVDPAVIGGNTVALWEAWLAANPLQVVYELATPLEIDLTPVSVSSLLGQNNVWCNTGDTELDYYPAAASVVAVLNRSSKVYTSIPLGKIRYDTYQTTPNQALDLDSYRAETGVLIRNVLSHTATKIEFNTPSMTNLQWEEVWNIIKAGFNNSTERKLKLKYYDQMSATYKTGWFYVPDVNFTIRNIDEAAGIINYDEIRVAFIEY